MRSKRIGVGVAITTLALVAAACGSSKNNGNSGAGTSTAGGSATTAAKGCAAGETPDGPWGWCGTAATGYLPPNEPDVNQDGKVKIGVISPGDLNDKGYYQSFVDTADKFASENNWTVIKVGNQRGKAVAAARNMCQQGVDMVAIAASELKDAIPVAQEAVCKNTVWYVAGGQGVTQTKYFVQTNDVLSQGGYASGVAAGLILKDSAKLAAGFITGPQASFTTDFFKAWSAGIKSVVPDANPIATYTGDFDKADVNVAAYNAQKAKGIGVVYPYLGGATFAVAGAANKDNIPVLTPGTDNCAVPSPKFAVSVIFSPGAYFAAALTPFKDGTLRVGTALTFHMGKDPVPTVKFCNPTGDQAQQLADTITKIGNGEINTGTATGLNDYGSYDPTKP